MAGTPETAVSGQQSAISGGARQLPGAGAGATSGGWAGKFEAIMSMYDRGDMAKLTPAQQVVLVYLISRANATGFAWPAVGTIAAATGLSDRHVIRTIDQLAAEQLVRRTRDGGGRRSTTYVVTPLAAPERARRGELPEREINTCPSDPAFNTCPSDSSAPGRSPGIGPGNDPPAAHNGATSGANSGGRAPPEGDTGVIAGVTSCHSWGDIMSPDPRSLILGHGSTALEGDCAQPPEPRPGGTPPPEKVGEQNRPGALPGAGVGLFDAHAAADLLAERGFTPRDVARQMGRYGPQLVRRAIAEADVIARRGRVRSYRGLVVSILADGGGWVSEREATIHRIYPAPEVAPPPEVGDGALPGPGAGAITFGELDDAQRAELRRRVLDAMTPAARRLHERLPPDRPVMRALIEHEANEIGPLFLLAPET